jgi:hypothetical protein
VRRAGTAGGAAPFRPIPSRARAAPSAADIPLLAYLFERALEAHPKSQELLILHLVFLRFVFRDAQSAAYREKVTKRINSELRTDLKFALYAGEPPCQHALAKRAFV